MSKHEFQRNFAVIIGINDYSNGIPPLETAVPDARKLAEILEDYKYSVRLLLNQEASLEGLNQLLAAFHAQKIPLAQETIALNENDRIVFYFAGHGLALDALENEEGPAGYLVPAEARPGNINTYLQMQKLHDALLALPCKHLLVILDCCFAGAFRWSSHKRNVVRLPVVYQERYDRFIQDRAWQVIASAADDEKALDFVASRGTVEHHSPFATALFQALRGDADIFLPVQDGTPTGDGVITATELYVYLGAKLATMTQKLHSRQTPGLYHLAKHDNGEYIFLVPGHKLNLPSAPQLNLENNPYRGLESFDEAHSDLFFGRKQLTQELSQVVCDRQLTVVLGASGTGKSSLVKAGLLPYLRKSTTDQWHIIDPIRPGISPITALSLVQKQLSTPKEKKLPLLDVVTTWCNANPQSKLLLAIDQFEELVTMCQNDKERSQFFKELEQALTQPQFHIVITLRLDFEPQFLTSAFPSRWRNARFMIPPMTQNELREVIEKPAAEQVLYFEPPQLVEQLINEVVQMPGALPLLSFTLSELYLKYLNRRGDNRALTEQDYNDLGGVAGSLTRRATQEYEKLVKMDSAYDYTIRKVMLRMVTVDGGAMARRRVPLREFEYPNAEDNERVEEIIQRFTDARLIVSGKEVNGEPYVEPAHDALVLGWNLLQKWKDDKHQNESVVLRQRLTLAANDWYNNDRKSDYLWSHDPRIAVLEKVLEYPPQKNWLNQLETEFVKSSIHKRQDELEEARERWRISQERQQIAQARLLATQAQLIQREDISLLQLSTLLAVESMKRFNKLEMRYLLADQTLRQGLALLPRSIARINKQNQQNYTCSNSLAFCSDGKHIAIANDAIRLLEIKSGQEVASLEYEKNVTVATLSPDGNYAATYCAATCAQKGVVKVWQLKNQQLIAEIVRAEPVQYIIFSPNSQYILIVSGGFRGVWQLTDSSDVIPVALPLLKLPDFSSAQEPISFSPDGKYLAEFVEDSPGSGEGRRQVWKLSSRRRVINETVNLSSPSSSEVNLAVSENIDDIAFSSDGQFFAATVTLTTIKVWKIPSGREVMTMEHNAWINTIAVSFNGQYIAVGDRKGEAIVWEVPHGYQVAYIKDNPTTWLGRVIFSPDGNHLATVGKGFNKIARVYHVFRGQEVARLLHENYVVNIAFSRDGKYIATQEDSNPEKGYSDTVRLWQIVDNFDGKIAIELDLENFINSITTSSRGKYLGMTCSQASGLQVYDMEHYQKVRFIHHEGAHYAAFSTDEKLVATVGEDRTVKLWELASGEELLAIEHNAPVIAIAFSQDAKFLTTLVHLTTIYRDNIEVLICDVIVWDITTYQQVDKLENIKFISMSPDGNYLVILPENANFLDKNLLIIKVVGRKEVTRITLDNEGLSEFILSTDGKYLAGFGGFYGSDTSVDSDGFIQVWDLSGEEVLPVIKLGRSVTKVVFSPGSRFLAAAVGGDTVRIWDLISKQEVSRIEVYGGINHIIFSWDSEHLVTVNCLNKVQIWNLQPEILIEEACSRLTCNLTLEEWNLYLGEPYQKTCPNV
ncbi:caspase family protein [Scytonema sp. NUACC26]|uniref:nSTAND1 domain-containing NTPase n=1 Tax=Scytonema sp. NUACC26 TaxID=3140176 RepID=UPI0034DC445D